MSKRPLTPCIGICSTAIGDQVCRGCKRFAEEVIRWNSYSDDQRLSVLNRLDHLLVQSVQIKFTIVDEKKLQEQIRYQQINCQFDKDPYCWLYDLLRQGASQIKKLGDFGAKINSSWEAYTLVELKDKIDSDYFERSKDYYNRYIVPGEEALKNAQTVIEA